MFKTKPHKSAMPNFEPRIMWMNRKWGECTSSKEAIQLNHFSNLRRK
jgi:hypothetical protein